jgi:hypothetical protein
MMGIWHRGPKKPRPGRKSDLLLERLDSEIADVSGILTTGEIG